jgi:peptide/nickel transport system permease protein
VRQYIISRISLSIPVLLLVLIGTFLLVNAIPGDVIENRFAGSSVSKEQVEEFKKEAGLDRPMYEQFGRWLANVFQGDLGTSLFTGRSVTDELSDRALPTIEIGVLALVLGIVIAIPLGTLSALLPNSPVDYLARFLTIIGLAIPDFVLAVVVILIASKYWGYFPPIGFTTPLKDLSTNVEQIWMPVLVIGVRQSAGVARLTRSTLLEVLRSDYIRTARAKGLGQQVVVIRHALRNSLIPVITIIGLQASGVIGGVVIIESLFNIPGMGSYLVQSVQLQDLLPMQSLVLIFASTLILVNLLVDISYSWLDPRITLR